jgi:hypothetical protein
MVAEGRRVGDQEKQLGNSRRMLVLTCRQERRRVGGGRVKDRE